MCVFVDPKQSYIEVIQNIGRICRKNKTTNKLATILIPTVVDVNRYKECKTYNEQDNAIKNELSKSGDFNGIWPVLSALRQEDPYIVELCLHSPDVVTKKEINDTVKKRWNKLDEKVDLPKYLFETYDVVYSENINEIDNFKNIKW